MADSDCKNTLKRWLQGGDAKEGSKMVDTTLTHPPFFRQSFVSWEPGVLTPAIYTDRTHPMAVHAFLQAFHGPHLLLVFSKSLNTHMDTFIPGHGAHVWISPVQ